MTSTTKPTAMEKVKEKAAIVVDKITGKSHSHDTVHVQEGNVDPATHVHPHLQPQQQPQSHAYVPATNLKTTGAPLQHSDPLHTGAALSSTAVPHKPTVEGTAYEQQFLPHGTQSTTRTTAVPTAPATAITANARHHGIGTDLPQQPVVTTGASAGVPLATTNQYQPVITTTTTNTTGGAPVVTTGATSGIPSATTAHQQHRHPAAPSLANTKGDPIPNYTQNIAPPATGVVPTAFAADPIGVNQQHGGPNDPVNTNPFVKDTHGHTQHSHHYPHMTETSRLGDTTVPAMGAPGTTTAAGTHLPGQYQSGRIANPPTPPPRS